MQNSYRIIGNGYEAYFTTLESAKRARAEWVAQEGASNVPPIQTLTSSHTQGSVHQDVWDRAEPTSYLTVVRNPDGTESRIVQERPDGWNDRLPTSRHDMSRGPGLARAAGYASRDPRYWP